MGNVNISPTHGCNCWTCVELRKGRSGICVEVLDPVRCFRCRQGWTFGHQCHTTFTIPIRIWP
jgi:hypothetical protein